MLKCMLIDDEPHAMRLLEMYIKQTPFLSLSFATSNSLEGLDYMNQNDVDLIFMDIDMPQLKGIELVKMTPQKDKVIFTTAFSQYTLDAFEEGVLDYLLKPISYDRFLKAVQKGVRKNRIDNQTNLIEEIYVKGDDKGKMTKINLCDIFYIEGMKNYMAFHTTISQNPIIALLTFKELEEFLPLNFVRVHKSFIVSLSEVIGIDGNEIIVRTGKKDIKIPLGGTYRDGFLSIINKKTAIRRN